MVVDVELNIPPKFFESAKLDNKFESVSERIAKQFITSILKIPSVKRGNAELKEPDYVSEGLGFEVTFAVNEALIPQLKGVKPIDPSMWNMEEELIDSVLDAVERKAKKTYSCPTSLVVITLETLYIWYHTIYSGVSKDWFEQLAWNIYTKKRNTLFNDIFKKYIQTKVFDNVYIIQPTHVKEFAFFDINGFVNKDEEFVTRVGVTNPELFPTYSIIQVQKEKYSEPIKFRTTIINRA